MKSVKILGFLLTLLSSHLATAQKYFDANHFYSGTTSADIKHSYFSNGDYAIVCSFSDSFILSKDVKLTTSSSLYSELLVAKYNSNDSLLWYYQTETTSGSSSVMIAGEQFVILPNNQIVVCGSFTNSKKFGPFNTVNAGSVFSSFVLKLTADGQYQTMTNSQKSVGSALCADPMGNIYLGGFRYTVGSNSEAFISKYNTNFIHIKTQEFVGVFSDRSTVLGMVCDANNNLYYTGNFQGDTFALQNTTLPGNSDLSFEHLFYGKLNANLDPVWLKGSKVLGANINLTRAKQIQYLPNHNLVITGTHQGYASFGFDTLQTSSSGKFSFMLFVDSLGNGKNIYTYNLKNNDFARALIGNICVEDSFIYSISTISNGLAFGSKTLYYGNITLNIGKNALFLMKHSLNGDILEAFSTPVDSSYAFTPFELSKYGNKYMVHLYRTDNNTVNLEGLSFKKGTYKMSIKNCEAAIKFPLSSGPLKFCEGNSSTVTLNALMPKIYWYKDNALVDSMKNTLTVNSSSQWHSMGTNQQGCAYYTDTLQFTKNNNPVASFTGLKSEYCPIDTIVKLIGTPSGGTFSGAGVSSDTFNPIGLAAGNYKITYDYTDANSCKDTFTQSITIKTKAQCFTSLTEQMIGNVHMYPNPSSEQLRIEFAQDMETYSIVLISSTGQMVLEELGKGTSILLNVSDLPNGIYTVLFNNETGNAVMGKVNVMR